MCVLQKYRTVLSSIQILEKSSMFLLNCLASCVLYYVVNSMSHEIDEHLVDDLGKVHASKVWLQYLEKSLMETFQPKQERRQLLWLKILYKSTSQMIRWCLPSTLSSSKLNNNVVINIQSWLPCGYVHINLGVPSKFNDATYKMQIVKQLLIQINFLKFMLDATHNCLHSSYLLVCIKQLGHWTCPIPMKYCGHRKPWLETVDSNRAAVVLKQLNVRYACNITFTYTSVERNIAQVYMRHKNYNKVNRIINPMTIRWWSTIHYVVKWRVESIRGTSANFLLIRTCCLLGVVEIHDGFENYHMLYKKNIVNINFSNETLDLSSTYYVSTINLYPNKSHVNSDYKEVFLLMFVTKMERVIRLSINQTSTFNNKERPLQSIYKISITDGGFPNISFNMRNFSGWNEDQCAFGGFTLLHNIKTNIIVRYDQGPFCTGTSPSEPFIGTNGPKYIVLGEFVYYLIIYALGPWYSIDVDVLMKRSFCEGIFEPYNMCRTPIPSKRYHSKNYMSLDRYIFGSHYVMICATMEHPHTKEKTVSIDFIQITKCIIFQSISWPVGIVEIYKFYATLNVSLNVLVGHQHLPLYEVTSKQFNSFHITTHTNGSDVINILQSFKKDFRNVGSLTLVISNYKQYLGQYVFLVLTRTENLGNCTSSGEMIRKNYKSKNVMGIVGIFNFCGDLHYYRKAIYSFQFQIIPSLNENIKHFMYLYFASSCLNESTTNVLTVTVDRGSLMSHSVQFIFPTLQVSQCFMPLTFMFHNNKNCWIRLKYRIRLFEAFAKFTIQPKTSILLVRFCMTKILQCMH